MTRSKAAPALDFSDERPHRGEELRAAQGVFAADAVGIGRVCEGSKP